MKKQDMKEQEKSYRLEKAKILVSIISLIVGLFAGITLTISIGDDVILSLFSFHNSTEKEMSFYKAQEAFEKEDYQSAMEFYQEHSEEDGKCCVNVGYMYSFGLGCEQNYELAIKYYKKAYEDFSIEEGLDNYLALAIRRSYNHGEAIKAVEYGVKNGHASAIKFAAYLHNGHFKDEVNDTIEEAADDFLNGTQEEKTSKLRKSLSLGRTKAILTSEAKSDDDFHKYIELGSVLATTEEKYKYIQVGENDFRWILCYETAEYSAEITYSYGFTNILFKESFYRV